MSYFTQADIEAIVNNDAVGIDDATQKLQALHKKVYEQIQVNDLDLHLIVPPSQAVQYISCSDFDADDVLTVTYMRKREMAVAVERLLGRDEVATVNTIEPRFHTVIELRLYADGFVIELLMSPDAWWDQQNLVGKLSIPRHKQEFYSVLRDINSAQSMGFWGGAHLSDMHLAAKYFQHPRIMNEWFSTFTPTKDWFRLGMWYDLPSETLTDENIVAEVMEQMAHLYKIYEFGTWTNDNNFRDFVTQ